MVPIGVHLMALATELLKDWLAASHTKRPLEVNFASPFQNLAPVDETHGLFR